jgi:anaerobic ribonucleoside-triphosphate reductase activating protein
MTGELLRVAETHPACEVLGPGTRFVVWVQGCPMRCPDCVSPQWLPAGGGHLVPVARLAEQVADQATDGLTLSGGEPFAQAEALAALVAQVRARRDMSVLSYTGYPLGWLRGHGTAAQRRLLGQLDIVIDGPYVRRLHADLRWRGSANQRVHLLTLRHAADLTGPDTGVGLQLDLAGDGSVRWLGVPPVPGFRSDFERALDLTRIVDTEGAGQ